MRTQMKSLMTGKEKMDERSLNDKTILVTGGAGFIGSHFIRYILEKYSQCRILNLDNLTYAGNLDNLKDIEKNPRYEFIKGDIRDKKLVNGIFKKVQIVVHMAAETHVDRSIVDAGEFVLTDVFGTFVLLESLKKSNIEFFAHVSTDEVYGSTDADSFREGDAFNPSSPYAASKAGADHLVHSYHVTFGLPVITVRPSNNYGPYQFPEKFIPLFITNALDDKKLPLYGEGKNRRDWLFVRDNCRAIDCILRRGKIGEAYNVGAQEEKKNIEVAEKILELLGKPKSLIEFVKDRPGHDMRYFLDCKKIHSLGWKAEKEFFEGLQETVLWYEQNEDWWRKLKQKNREFKKFYRKYYKKNR